MGAESKPRSDRKGPPIEARLTEAQLRDLMESLPHLVWTCLAEGPCDYLSQQWVDYTGISEAEQLGYGWLLQLHLDDRERVKAEWAATVGGGIPFDIEFRIRRADGAHRSFRTRAIPLRDASGTIVKWYGSNTDIEDYKRSEESLKLSEESIRQLNENLERLVHERTAQLTAANAELEAFSYSVAHDLRAPLRGMNGFASILLSEYKDKVLDEEGLDYLDRIRSNAILMGQLIDALLSLARVARSELRLEVTDLSAVARSIIDQLATSDPGHSREIVLREGLRARMDPALARTLLENLIGNAWKFTGGSPAPKIEVGVTDHEGSLAFFVRDNGAGFNMAQSERLFVAFQRLHTAREFPGTGIGLATARRIVDRHGGRIWAEGKIGEGATFFFAFPETKEA